MAISRPGKTTAALCRAVALSAAMLTSAALHSASAQNGALVARIYVFGDSYSDGGNGYALTKKPQSPPYASRYSNGPTAVEYMAKAFGVTLRYSEDPSVTAESSMNFAVSGAWTSSKNNDAATDGKTGLLSQVSAFQQRLRNGKLRFHPDTTLFFIAIGTNDVLFGNLGGQDNATIVAEALQNVEQAVRSLHAAGARHIALGTIPSVSRTPRGASLGEREARAVGAAVVSLNQGYQKTADKLRAELKADVFLIPWGQYYDDVMSNPSAFGIANSGSCITSTPQRTSVCSAPERFVFWDVLHPSTATHKAVGLRLAAQGRPHFTCPTDLNVERASENPVCRFSEAAEGPVGDAQQAGTNKCQHVAVRQFADMCGNCTAPPWSGEVKKISADDWTVEVHDRPLRGSWRLISQSDAELVFYDAKGDLYTRYDLTTHKGWQRRGVHGPWAATSDIINTDCR